MKYAVIGAAGPVRSVQWGAVILGALGASAISAVLLAFGAGIHHCLGATLARVEGQEVFKALAERFPGLQLDNEALEYQPSITFRSLKSLPIHWQ